MKKNYMKEYEKQKAEQVKKAKNRLNDVCELLSSLGINEVVGRYDGCGDSGAIDEINYFTSKGAYTGDLPVNPFDSVYTEGLKISLHDCFEELFCTFLPDGWEINDGAYGECTLNTLKKIVTIDHNARYTDSISSQEVIAL